MSVHGMQLSLAQLHQWLPGSRLVGDGHRWIQRVHTDSRSVQANDLFVALRGERFDGHDFLSSLPGAGVHDALAEHGLASAALSGVEVSDSLQALQTLSRCWRAQWAGPLIAVAGSNGKTTVTQMIAAILRAWQGELALATQGNFNNHIGVPLTLLRLRAQHRVAVLELGMNHPGEIAVLAACAQPTVALVNNAQREHQEFMQSVQAVAEENGSVIDALPEQGVAVFPRTDPHQHGWRQKAGARRVIDFGDGQSAVHLLNNTWTDEGWQWRMHTPLGAMEGRLALPGQHNLHNAQAAVAAALAVGAPLTSIEQGLSQFTPVAGRSQRHALHHQGRVIHLIDDSYNANPDSVQAAIDVLAQSAGPRLLVLGDMGEVGSQGPAFHAEAGAHAHAAGIEHVLTLGELARHTAQACPEATHMDSMTTLQNAVLSVLPNITTVLVKGSRFMHMERVVQTLLQLNQAQAPLYPQETPCC